MVVIDVNREKSFVLIRLFLFVERT